MLTEKQLTTQEAILKRLYPWVSMEEILGKEYILDNCILYSDSFYHIHQYWKNVIMKQTEWCIFTKWSYNIYHSKQIIKSIIGLPPTLSRVLTALWDYCYLDWSIFELITRDTEYICKRKPLNEDMTECNLRQQSQKTQDVIYNILCKE